MTRRTVVQLLVVLAPWARWRSPRPPTYGPVDVDRYAALRQQGIDLRVLHHGTDITSGCFLVDDTGEGYARRFLHNADGKVYWDPHINAPAQETIVGIQLVARRLPV